MANKSYAKGYRFEWEVKRYLERLGYLVFRTAGSHSVADLIAVDHILWKTVYLIQCKYGTARMNKAEIVALVETAKRYNTVPIYCCRRAGKSISFMNLNTTTEMKFVEKEN